MTTTMEDKLQGKTPRWALHRLQSNGPWNGFVMTQPYPIAEDRSAYRQAVAAILGSMPESRPPATAQAFLQMDRIDFRKDTPVVQQHSAILGDYGLGIYPQLPPPAKWTREEFSSLFHPQKLRPLAHDIMRVDSNAEDIATIRDLFLGSGAYAQVFCASGTSFYQAATALFKPLITDKLMRTFPYHAPLLQRSAVESCTPAQLDAWACGAVVYLRESVEDHGLLVLRRGELEPVLKGLADGHTYPQAKFLLD